MSNIQYITHMEVIKRDGRREQIQFDKITTRIKNLCDDIDLKQIDPIYVAQQTIQKLKNGITTEEIDIFSSQICVSLAGDNPRYSNIAGKICISNLHKKTSNSFYETVKKLYFNKDFKGDHVPLVSYDFYKTVDRHKRMLDKAIDHDRDYHFDYFGFKTLERAYLTKINNEVIERPQYMWMRVSVAIHMDNIEKAIETYNYMSQGYFTHATPTLFNAGTVRQQCSSCYLIGIEDSIDGIYDTIKRCAKISKFAGGIGLHVSNIRAQGSIIRGTNGNSNGIVPMLKVFNETARYVDQCFIPETIIYTKDGFKRIDQIVVGDKVVTNDGTLQRVSQIMQDNYDDEMIKIDVMHSLFPLIVTENHPIYILNEKLMQADYIDAKNIKLNDLVGIPIPTYEKDIPEYTLDDCRFYGILVGNGNISHDDSVIYVDGNIDFVRTYLDDRLIPYTIDDNIITWNKNNRFKFNRAMLYDCNGEKIIHKNMLHLPKEKSLMLIRGLIESNGYIDDDITIEMISHNVIENLRYILLRFGVGTLGNVVNETNQYILKIPKVDIIANLFGIQKETCTYFVHDNLIWTRVNNMDKVHFKGTVLDLRIENNHNYLTHSGLVHNGGGRRKGSFAIYLEPHHADILDFLELKLNTGSEDMRARDLFLALWINDLFMKRVENDELWSLMCPDVCPGLTEVYGEEYKELYERYEKEGKYKKQIPARELWKKIYISMVETGTPYMLNKDAANTKSNQKNIGTIKSSNLCAEICEYSSDTEVAVCNLASIALSKFVNPDQTFDFEKLKTVSYIVTRNLNKVIDINYYPIIETAKSNFKHRPIGLGVQGLADTYVQMRIPFDSQRAHQLNKQIFETIYYGACLASNDIAKERALYFAEYFEKHENKYPRGYTKLKDGFDIMKWGKFNVTKDEFEMITNDKISSDLKGTYITFAGSPFSEGKFQFDLWNKTDELSGMWNWDELRQNVIKYGMRNSLLTALMPTASTSQILGNNEAFEPFTSNIYKRRTLAGEFIILNKYLVEDLIKLDLWNRDMKNDIINNNGSIQDIKSIPKDIKKLYKTVWEIKQKHIVMQAADRGIYIDQSQSMNIFMEKPDFNKVTSMLFTGWKLGLKTMMYYLRSKPATNALKFSLGNKVKNIKQESEEECLVCSA
jgi:ribonucleotide reductase alpha subunit